MQASSSPGRNFLLGSSEKSPTLQICSSLSVWLWLGTQGVLVSHAERPRKYHADRYVYFWDAWRSSYWSCVFSSLSDYIETVLFLEFQHCNQWTRVNQSSDCKLDFLTILVGATFNIHAQALIKISGWLFPSYTCMLSAREFSAILQRI